ncbi:MAG: hypothetical protein AB7D06_14985 [Pedobacter sp.]
MKKIPTDLKILNEIYKRYFAFYESHTPDNPNRSTKNYVPIEISKIAECLKAEGNIVFGRLYYHLEKKYGYTNEDGTKVPLFALNFADGEMHCVNFPYMASVLAELREENKKFKLATSIAVLSIIISIISLFIAAS